MSVVQKYLAGLIGLSALYLVGTQGKGLEAAFGGAEKFVGGTLKVAQGRG